MTFKTSAVITLKSMLPIFFREWYLIPKHIKDITQSLKFFRLIQETL